MSIGALCQQLLLNPARSDFSSRLAFQLHSLLPQASKRLHGTTTTFHLPLWQ